MAYYVLPQKSINYCTSRGYSVAEIWTNLRDNGITYCKVLPIKEPLEMQHCWQAMGFTNTHIQVNITPFSSPESVLASAGLYNGLEWNSVYERIIGTAKDNPIGLWKHKPKGVNEKKEWLARDKKNGKQRKWKQFNSLYELCRYYNLRYDYVERQFTNGLEMFCTSSNILIKKTS